jgi:hypothetical protein
VTGFPAATFTFRASNACNSASAKMKSSFRGASRVAVTRRYRALTFSSGKSCGLTPGLGTSSLVRSTRTSDAGLKGIVVTRFDLVADRKSEARADSVEIIVTSDDHEARKLDRLAQIDLHPLHGIRGVRDLAVIAELRFRDGLALLAQLFDFRVDRGQLCSAPLSNFGIELLPFLPQGVSFSEQMLPLLVNFGIGVELPVRSIDRGEDRLQAVVVFHLKRIELVIVAPRAADRHAIKRFHRRADHVVPIEAAGDLSVELGLGNFDVADEVPRTGRDEAGRDDSRRIVRKQHVPRDLLLDESRVRFVVVEGANHVVPIVIRVRPEFVLVVAVRIGVMNDIQPVPRPALSVAGRREVTVDQLFVCKRIGIAHEFLNLFGSRRQTEQIELEPPDQRAAVRFGRG